MKHTAFVLMLGLGASACTGAEPVATPAITAGPNQVRGEFVLDKVP